MSLTGNLEIFPMPEVLRLLSRSKKTGCLSVDAVETQGRVFLAGGAITFANTESDDVIRRALINAGLVTEDSLRAANGSLPDAIADGVDAGAISDFVREQVVESLYRIRKPGHGDFEFAVDVAPTFVTGQQFDAEVAVAESERRAAEWADILDSIQNLDAPVKMVRELADDNSVTIAAPTWKVLASLEGGTSVRELAYRTGMSEFRAARELSGLVRSSLVTVVDRLSSFESGYQAPVIERRPAPVFDEPAVDEPSISEPDVEQPVPVADDFESFFDTTPVEQPQNEVETPVAPAEESTWGASPWDTPEQAPSEEPTPEHAGWFEDSVTEGGVDTEPSEALVEEASAEPEPKEVNADGGWWATAMETPQEKADAPSDPDSFLESVFSQLSDDGEQTESTDDETGFSMGLLRRRRMGTAARDITEG
jgi:hypothetical protein